MKIIFRPFLLFCILVVVFIVLVGTYSEIHAKKQNKTLISDSPAIMEQLPVTSDTQPIDSVTYSVVDIILPAYLFPDTGPSGESFPISVVITNTGDDYGTCDIPLQINDVKDSTNTVTFFKSVSLDAGEIKEVIFNSVDLTEGGYLVQVGNKSKYLNVY